MARGRCSGCGFEDASLRRVAAHTNECPEYIALYSKDPARALSPEAEHLRYVSLRDSEAGAEEKEARRLATARKYKEQNDRRVTAHADRWSGGSRTFNSSPTLTPEDGNIRNSMSTIGGRVASLRGTGNL